MEFACLNKIAEILCGTMKNSDSKFLNVLISEQLLKC